MAEKVIHLLRERVCLLDREGSYHPAIDTVLLAASAHLHTGAHWLDAGCANGGVAFCMLARASDIQVTGLERSSVYAEDARLNAERNGMAGQFHVIEGDLASPPAAFRQKDFDHIITNPPFFTSHAHTSPQHTARHEAHHETSLTIDQWIHHGLKRLRPKGSLTLIHRSEALPDILDALTGTCGDIHVMPILMREGSGLCKRILVRAVKGSGAPLQLLPMLTVMQADGSYKACMRDVLENALPLNEVSHWPK